MKTVLITGCSSGYGLETARHFHAQGWNVIATVRNPRAHVLPASERLRVVPLDVTKPDSITTALEASGPIDVLVNNAGDRCRRRVRSDADGDDARAVRDQYVRRHGDDTGGAASIPRAQDWCRHQCDVERDAQADAAGGRLYREQHAGA